MSRPPHVRRRVRRSTRTAGSLYVKPSGDGFEDEPPLDAVDGAEEAIPATAVERLVERYAGRGVPLDKAFPEPPADGPLNAAEGMQTSNGHITGQIVEPDPASDYFNGTEDAYRKEHRLKLVSRLMLRDATMPQIAEALEVSIHEAYQLRGELFSRMRREAGSIDMATHAGKTMAFYGEIRATAMRGHDMSGITHADKQRYLQLAMAAENNMHRFLQASGFYKKASFAPSESGLDGRDDDMLLLQNAMKNLMDPEMYVEGTLDSMSDDQLLGTSKSDDQDDMVRVL